MDPQTVKLLILLVFFFAVAVVLLWNGPWRGGGDGQ